MLRKIAPILVMLSACSFRTPNLQEQQVLIQKGSFPSGNPDWIYTPTGGTKGYGMSGGFFGLDGSTDYKASSNRFQPDRSILPETKTQNTLKRELSDIKKIETPIETKSKGPLDRINAVCPTVESSVNEALTTIELDERITKYEAITRKCDQSSDIWFWLAQDYEKNGDLVKANRSYEKALVAAPTMLDAENGSARVKKMMSEMNNSKDKK